MGWWLTSADVPLPSGADQSLNVALITTLGGVVVALIVLAGQLLNRSSRTSPSPPEPTPQIGERIVATEIRTADNARTLDVLDRHVDGQDDRMDGITSRQDKTEWILADLLAWRDEHRRTHGHQS